MALDLLSLSQNDMQKSKNKGTKKFKYQKNFQCIKNQNTFQYLIGKNPTFICLSTHTKLPKFHDTNNCIISLMKKKTMDPRIIMKGLQLLPSSNYCPHKTHNFLHIFLKSINFNILKFCRQIINHQKPYTK
jgi:hypothetical protein